ncbi:MAG TPA: Orn/Lys/Arg decarboxylase N-terminal domain-containing protein, partial [Steroidobacteraceae bacterium]|nr:Orn/Lys/Arg decarboxylase N-terminal domain-containing protein [Steroidobacteraceae bacterium]
MQDFAAKTPNIPIPFHRLLKVVALVDAANPQVAALLERLRAENIEVEVSDRYSRDVSEDSDVGAYIASVDGARREHARTLGKAIRDCGFTTPLWALADSSRIADVSVLGMIGEVNGFVYLGQQTPTFYAKQIIASITSYGMSLLPPFFGALMGYDSEGKISFACPGHQGGEFYRKSPAGQLFFKHFGEQIFRNDLCNADVELGDLLIHVGPAVDAQRYAARVFGADRTYFVLNGTSTANKVVTQAVLKRGDLVLFDRNNHKSLHQGALVKAGATPIFLPTARNSFGMIGAVDWDAWDEKSLREQIRTNPMVKDPELYKAERPFRMACIQLATYDGTVYNVRKVMEKIGHLCDYVLWDEAWIGYNAFHPLFTDHSPMRLEKLTADMAGLFSTQSVHKQGAGFSQASQIHKRDEHIKGQRRFIEHKRFNESFLMYCSTSPFYPLFAALDVNAKIHAGKAGEMLWDRCIALGIEARKKLREYGQHFARTGRDAEEKWFFDPFVPDTVNIRGSKFTPDATNVAWEDLPTDVLKQEQQCWTFDPKSAWHGYKGYSENYAMVDPNKLMLLTPGIDRKTGEYLDFGVPATVLANYLREQRIVPEK